MRSPLLCELHAHTTFSDGALSPSELVDLYGSAGFDVLAITDHVCRTGKSPCSLGAEDHRATSRRSKLRPSGRGCSTTCS
jgi:predicted metal-dependent phosphoesterase TrpH